MATLALIVSLGGQAEAEPPAAVSLTPAQRAMSQRMHTYFRGELDAAAMALGLGAGSGWVGGMLLAQATDGSRAAAVPMITASVAEIAIGIGLFLRTPGQVEELDALIRDDPARYVAEEGTRMEGVIDRFGLLNIAETTMILSGGITTMVGAVLDEDRATGAGIGLLAVGTIAMGFDALADARAERYRDGIRRFEAVQVAPMVGTSSYGLTVGGAF